MICSRTALLHHIVLGAFFLFLFLDVILAPIHTTPFLLCVTACPFKNTSINKKAIFARGPEGTRELPPLPEVRESWRVEVQYGKACYDLTQPRDSITTHTGLYNRELVQNALKYYSPGLFPTTWSDSVILLPYPQPYPLFTL